MAETIAILPIKQHSERVPNKNFRLLNGHPLWQWAARICYLSDVIDYVVVDTDCRQPLCEELPAWITTGNFIFRERPADLQGDDVSMNKVIAAVVEEYEAKVFVQVHATNPFLSPHTVRWALDVLDVSDGDSVWTATKHQARFYNGKGIPVNHNPSQLLPTQLLQPIYEENSSLYLFRQKAFLKNNKRRICGDAQRLDISPLEGIDIDTEDTWKLAVIVAAGLRRAGCDIWRKDAVQWARS